MGVLLVLQHKFCRFCRFCLGKSRPASRAYAPYLSWPVPASFVGLEDCLAFSWWLPYQIAARSLVKQVGGGPETTWVPGMLATFDLCNRNGAPSAGASRCPADRLVWSLFSISTVSPLVSRVRLDTLLPRKRSLLSASAGTQRCVEFPLAFLYHANAPAMFLPRVRQGGCSTISGADRFDTIRGTGFDSAGHPDGELPILQMILFA